MALLSFVESAPRAYRLKASNAASPISTSSGTIPAVLATAVMRRSRPVIVRDRGASRGLREKGDGWACFGCGFSELFASFAQPIGGVHLALLLEIRRGCELLTHHDDDACAGHVKNIFGLQNYLYAQQTCRARHKFWRRYALSASVARNA